MPIKDTKKETQDTSPEISENPIQMPTAKPIGTEQVKAAYQTLQKYKQGKANLEQRVVENEQWYKLRHWECMRKTATEQVEPTSAWLFNALANKHADAMDNFPSPNVLPRERGDKEEAKMLSSILPVVLEQNDFEKTYSDVWTYKLRSGTGVYSVLWDGAKLNGLGDISIKKADLLNLFWEAGVTDIQDSPNFFSIELRNNDSLIAQYPELKDKLGNSTIDLTRYVFDDTVDTSEKSAVVDWYYKKTEGTNTVLHYCKFCNDTVLFATENEPDRYPKGWYDHALYPFIFDPLYTLEGTPTGFGYIDIAKSSQEYIDRGNKAIMENMLCNVKPRHFVKEGGEVDVEEYADMTNDFVYYRGSGSPSDAISPIIAKPLSSVYLNALTMKVDELKEVTGNRDVSTGGSANGVIASSAIAALQEAGSKLSRDNIKASYRAYRQMVLMVIELIRQFYDTPRCFRIIGDDGQFDFADYSNKNIAPQPQQNMYGQTVGYRVPLFDLDITAEKASPYSKMSQNELALQFFGAGFFNPQMADQALVCLDMMDFDRKEFIMQKIEQNGTLLQQLQQMQQMLVGMASELDALKGTNDAQAMGMGMQMTDAPVPNGDVDTTMPNPEGEESNITKKARQRVADSTAPR